MSWPARIVCRAFSLVLLVAAAAVAQQNIPHTAYVYPAGGQQGSSFTVTVGGQYLDGAKEAIFAEDGMKAEVTGFFKPLQQKDLEDLRAQLKELEESHKMVAAKAAPTKLLATTPAVSAPAASSVTGKDAAPPRVATPWTPEDKDRAADLHRQIDATMRMRMAPSLSQTVTLRVTVEAHAALGNHELRLLTKEGLTNPINFLVDRLPETTQVVRLVPLTLAAGGGLPLSAQAHAAASGLPQQIVLPNILNGQMMPGSVDSYRFHAKKGQKIVVVAMTRALIPYMSDAVPGWFQLVLSLSDAKGQELAASDHFRFNQEAVIEQQIAEEGDYTLAVRDVLNRGREDFVYRIAIGEIPYVTGIFPLGGKAGSHTKVEAAGWNLPTTQYKTSLREVGTHAITANDRAWVASNAAAFAVDNLPETIAPASSASSKNARRVKMPLVINGRIEHPGDVQSFRIDAKAGEEVVAEVEARRLGSPLDSALTLTDEKGKQLAFNDDFEDKGAALLTHQADSRILYRFPAKGSYLLQLADTEQNGGPDYSYRLRISHPRPDFVLRVAPSSINLRPGRTTPIKVLLLRRDGFDGPVTLRIKDGPPGLVLSGGVIPAGSDTVRMTLTASPEPSGSLRKFLLEGEAEIAGHTVRHVGEPAEEMTQAFSWRHMVPVQQAMFTVLGNDRRKPFVSTTGERMRIPLGGTGLIRFAIPPGQVANHIQVELSDPPEGISIAEVNQSGGYLQLRLRADPKIKPGLAGNLLVEATATKPDAAPQGNNAKPMQLGYLPAIPFEVVPHT